MRNTPNPAPSSGMLSQSGTTGVQSADRGAPNLTLPLRKREPEPINGRTNGTADSSDSDRRVHERNSDQKKLSIITSQDDGSDRSQRPKPPLLRSKSDYAVRRDDQEHIRGQVLEWGARHGFEDHYQSEDIISQLANVSQLAFHPD